MKSQPHIALPYRLSRESRDAAARALCGGHARLPGFIPID
jgi:hypothetical protein